MYAKSKKANVLLWIAQIALAGLSLFALGCRLIAPAGAMLAPIALPGAFLRFIGVAGVLSALGLVFTMAGAMLLSAIGPSPAAGTLPLLVGLICLTDERRRGGCTTDAQYAHAGI